MRQDPPPILTVTEELLGWTLDRTASFPRCQRHTFGQRLDNLMLNALECCVVARFSTGEGRLTALKELNLIIEKLRVLWRLVNARGWISAGQLLFSARKLDEIGRMAGGWVKATTPCSP